MTGLRIIIKSDSSHKFGIGKPRTSAVIKKGRYQNTTSRIFIEIKRTWSIQIGYNESK